MLDEQLKRRLIGAVVLVALAVIFIPMLLEGPVPGAQKSADGIPKPPAHKFKTMDIPLQVPAPAPKGTVGEGTAAGQAAKAAMADQSAPATTTSAPLSIVQAKPAPAPAPQQGAATAKPAPQPAPKAQSSKPAAAAKPAATGTWVVQLGSFSDSGKAIALRNRVRAKHYDAYLEKAHADGRLFYRVRVGPVAKRAAAQQLQGEIDRDLKIKGLVMHR